MTRKIAAAGLAAIGCSMLLALPASAHVNVNPDSAPKGGFTKLTFCGLALDYCVAWSAIDALQARFGVAVVVEATAAIDLDGSKKRKLTEMRQAGINLNATA